MATTDPISLSAGAIATGVNNGSLTATAVALAYADRSCATEPSVGAFAHFDRKAFLHAADSCDRCGAAPLKGVPVGVKDVIDTADMPTAYGSVAYAGNRPSRDAAVVERIRRAGCVVAGKTTTCEFAIVAPTGTRNPAGLEHTPGGSSSGSAAAVAANMVPLAVGTQTGGSIIRPASFCGVVGYKPTFGWMDVSGIKPVSPSLDTVGVFAHSVQDASLFASVLADSAPAGSAIGANPPRIGVLRWAMLTEAEPAMLEAVSQAAQLADRHGAAVEVVNAPEWYERLDWAWNAILCFEMEQALAHDFAGRRDLLRPQTIDFYDANVGISPTTYQEAVTLLNASQRRLGELFGKCDVLLVPAAAGEAPKDLQISGSSQFNRVWTLLGGPCLSIPCGKGSQGMPLGIQLVGRPACDRGVLEAGAFLEAAIRSATAG